MSNLAVKKIFNGTFRFAAAVSAFGVLLGLSSNAFASGYHPQSDSDNDTVYTMNNAVAGNVVFAYKQSDAGVLSAAGNFPTGGKGTGSGLGNQGALATSGDYLLVVNAGSNDISVLRKHGASLKLVDRMSSGGSRPVSVAIDRDLVYVLNAGSDSIAGFYLQWNGRLQSLPGSTLPLSDSGVAAAQIGFSRDGRTLIVSEKATNRLVSFALNRRGVPTRSFVTASPGPTPFGFAVGRGNLLLVSEAAGGAASASSVTSYRVQFDGALEVVDAAVPLLQSAACWVAVTPNGRFAYTTNTASGNVSIVRVMRNGQLQPIDTANTGVGSGPIDMAFSEHGKFLNVLNAGTRSIASFKVMHDGSLQAIGSMGGVADSANGLAAF